MPNTAPIGIDMTWLDEMLEIIAKQSESSKEVERMANELRQMNEKRVSFATGNGAAQTRKFDV